MGVDYSLKRTAANRRGADVLNVPPGAQRNRRVEEWCSSVWDAYSRNRETIAGLLGDLAPQKV